MTDRSIKADARREELLAATVRVFARRGFHYAKMGEIAREAGVAYGLIYHYFPSKDALLETIFRESWGRLVEVLESIAAAPKPARERLRLVGAAILRTWRADPDLVRVLVREVARGPQLQASIGEVGEAFAAIRRIIEDGQAQGELRGDVDAQLATWIAYGALEEVLTAWALGQLPDDEDAVARAEHTFVETICGGLVRESAA